MLPGVWAYVSQIDLPLPSSFQAPSIWYDEVPMPQWKPSGNVRVAWGEALARTLVDCADAWPPNVAMGRPMAAAPASLTESRLLSSVSLAFIASLHSFKRPSRRRGTRATISRTRNPCRRANLHGAAR